MKAKEYLKLYNDSHNKELMLLKIGSDFIKEAASLMESRKCVCPNSVKAVLLEMSLKWIALARLDGTGAIKETGFRDLYRFKHRELCKKIGF
ncbi:MAG: hypothetical protein EOM12_09005 [Verrucomicrobiae bacterium]|nr:hypothetical protein [Verrucomicrobiae bacterium]